MIWKDDEGNIYKISYSEELLARKVRLLKAALLLLAAVAIIVPVAVFACVELLMR